jgi:hypothetical protein
LISIISKLKFFFIIFYASSALCADITKISDIDFGNITASPFGDIIQINALSGDSYPFVASGGYSSVSGGSWGTIRVEPDQPGQTVNINYPVSFVISKGADEMTVSQISINSTQNFITENTDPVDINIGGVLTIKNSQAAGNYSGSAVVNIIINNP